jgi:tetratricopeptide (TPR) repeat protein
MAGVGKTALAVQWAHSVAGRFPDGQLFVNLRGFDPAGRTVTASEGLSALCSALDVPLADLPEDAVDARAARFRAALTGRRVLLLLDNARDSEHVRPLLPGTPGCLALVTSRNRLSSLVVREGARTLPLGRLTPADGARLLADRLGPRRVAAEPAAAGAIVEQCAGLPLALSIAAARAATNPRLSLADIAGELASAQLDALATDDGLDDVRVAFGLSYEALSPAAARLFRLLAAHPGPEIPVAAAASLAGVPIGVARRLAAELLTASMLGEAAPGRYTIHDLLQLYGAELLDAAGERTDAERRLVHHYAASTRAAYLVYGRPPVGELAASAGPLTVEDFPNIAAAWRWFTGERPALIAAVHLAVAHGLDRCAATIALDWRPMSQGLLTHLELEPHVAVALRAAHRTGDLRLQGDLERDFASIHDKLDREGDAALAVDHWNRALDIFHALDDLAGQAQTLRNLGQSASLKGQFDVAEQRCRQALELARTLSRPDIVGLCLWELGVIFHRQRVRRDEAVDVLAEALDLARAHGLRYLESDVAAELSHCLLLADQPERALAVVDDYLARSGDRSSSDPETQLTLIAALAIGAFRVGDIDRAKAACLEFAARRRTLGSPVADGSSWTAWIAETQDEVIDLARTLELNLDLPDGR